MNSSSFLRKHRFRAKQKTEINVTPFVDVILVLLIVFMLTSHMMFNGFNIALPKSTEKLPVKEDIVNIVIDKKKKLYIEEKEIQSKELKKKISALLKQNSKINIVLHADKSIDYGTVMSVFTLLRSVSVEDVTLVTEE